VGAPLPDWLNVAGLKRRVDKQLSGDDVLLEEYLQGALAQAQAPYPLGCGRLLMPNPPLDGAGNDTAGPVTLGITASGRRIVLPDARTITKVEANDVEPEAWEDGQEWTSEWVAADEDLTPQVITNYQTTTRDGMVLQITMPRDHPLWSSRGERFSETRERTFVAVTGKFGFVTPPADLVEAIYILAARAFYEREVQYADQVQVAEGAAVQAYYRQLPPRTKLAFTSYAPEEGLGGLA
jgi:hypothetical protein